MHDNQLDLLDSASIFTGTLPHALRMRFWSCAVAPLATQPLRFDLPPVVNTRVEVAEGFEEDSFGLLSYNPWLQA